MASSSNSRRPNGAKTISESPPPSPIAELCARIDPIAGISLRPWHVDDAPVLAAAWADPEIARWNPVPPDASVEFAESWISSTSEQSAASVGIDVVLIDGDVLGEIGFQIDPARGIAELGFWLRSEARGHGHGTTLLMLALSMARQLELVGLVALTDPGNEAAVAMLARAGWGEVPTKSDRRAFARRV